MFTKLKKSLAKLARQPDPIDPTSFNDPVALLTEWTPLLKGGGCSFGTHKLVEIHPDRLEFRASMGARLFGMAFIITGIVIFAAAVLAAPPEDQVEWTTQERFFQCVFSVAFFGAGLWLLIHFTRPIVFDRARGYFWKGRNAPTDVFRPEQIRFYAELDAIHALQLLVEQVRRSSGGTGSNRTSSYRSYELNLVLTDGRRINVVDHGNVERLIKDAAQLAVFLGKPVWNA